MKTTKTLTVVLLLTLMIVIPVKAPSDLDPLSPSGFESVYHTFSVNPTSHDEYGLTYPVTYEFAIPNGASNLKAYKRFTSEADWVQIIEKTSNDFFNGIEAARFDYAENKAYVSISFTSNSDFICLYFTDSDGNEIITEFLGATEYYDNRRVAVVISIDDVGQPPPYGVEPQVLEDASIVFADAKVWWTAGVNTGEHYGYPPYETLQESIDRGYFEVAAHSRWHPHPPYGDYDSEIGGCKEDLITNLNLPYSKGDKEYVWCWIEPYGESDETVQYTLGEYKYLVSRSTEAYGYPVFYEEWNDEYGLFNRAKTTIWMDEASLTDLNNAFDYVYSEGGIYHAWGHIILGWEAGDKAYEHVQYVKGKKDVWYVGLGSLYAYAYTRMLVQSMSISITPTYVQMYIGESQAFDSLVTGGTGPYSYQWSLDESPVSGAADSTWTFTPTSAKTYKIHLWVTDNLNIQAQSNTVKDVYVYSPLSVSIGPACVNMTGGESQTFISTVSGGLPPYSYQWYLNNSQVSGAADSTWTFTPTSTGTYNIRLSVADSYAAAEQSNTATARVRPRFGVNYFSTHNHYEPYYLSDEELARDFSLFEDQGLEYVTLCAIWKYFEPELGDYNEAAINDLVRVCDFASQYNLKVVINFYTMMSNDSWTMPEWLAPRRFETVFLNETARQAWLNFLNYTAANLNSSESIWSWDMMNDPWRGEWACDVSIDDFLELWGEMKAVFKAYSDRPVSVRFAAQAFEDPNHFNCDPRIYTLFDYLALNYYEVYCPSENLTKVVLDAQQNGCMVVISEFGSNATDDADQASDYQRVLGLFRSLALTDCIAWMWRADYNLGGPDLPGEGYNLARDVDGTPRPAFLLLDYEYELAIAVEGSGSTVPASGNYVYEHGVEVDVTAIPDTGWIFDHWILDGWDVGSANPYKVTMNRPHSLTAVFIEIAPKEFNLGGVTAWYWTDDTIINSVVEGDVDYDGSVEVVTGGYYFDGERDCAQLVVWDGATLNVDRVTAWYWTNNTRINAVAVGNLDEDDALEIVTGGYYFDGTRKVAQLVVWDGATLAVDGVTTWYWTSDTDITSVQVTDIDGDGSAEIVTGGFHNDGVRDVAQLVVWDGAALAPLRYTSWYWTGDTRIYALSIENVDGDADKEIVTGGYYTDGRKIAQLVVWDGLLLSPENLATWYWTSNTEITSVVAANVDDDEDIEIVTGGFYNDYSRDIAQLVIWSSDLQTVENLTTWYWTSDTRITSLRVGDVDSDGSVEIITGGSYNDLSRDIAQLIVWDGATLAVDYLTGWYWSDDTCICSVAIGNVDGDLSPEIVTGGYFYDSSRNCAQLTIWEIS